VIATDNLPLDPAFSPAIWNVPVALIVKFDGAPAPDGKNSATAILTPAGGFNSLHVIGRPAAGTFTTGTTPLVSNVDLHAAIMLSVLLREISNLKCLVQ
jgi:hypothetical protein